MTWHLHFNYETKRINKCNWKGVHSMSTPHPVKDLMVHFQLITKIFNGSHCDHWLSVCTNRNDWQDTDHYYKIFISAFPYITIHCEWIITNILYTHYNLMFTVYIYILVCLEKIGLWILASLTSKIVNIQNNIGKIIISG